MILRRTQIINECFSKGKLSRNLPVMYIHTCKTCNDNKIFPSILVITEKIVYFLCNGSPMFLPLNFTPNALSNLPKICWFGTALPAS